MTPNSMADERTASVFSWINAPRRSRQKSDTIVKVAQLRSHYIRERGVSLLSLITKYLIMNSTGSGL